MNEINFPQFSWITKPSKNQRKEEKHQQKNFIVLQYPSFHLQVTSH